MSSRLFLAAPVALWAIPAGLAAQETSRALIGPLSNDHERDCQRRQDAAIISGEIVVCGDRADHDRHRLDPDGDGLRQFAERTMDKGLGLAPDFAAPPCVPNLLTYCPEFGGPPGPAVIVDLAALPEAPPGSAADRIARGEQPR